METEKKKKLNRIHIKMNKKEYDTSEIVTKNS